MTPHHMQAYVVAWDYILWALWLFVGLGVLVAIGCLVLVELANSRKPKDD